MQHRLGLVEGGRVDANLGFSGCHTRAEQLYLTIKTLGNLLVDVGVDVLVLEVDNLDLCAEGLGHGESGWDCVDGIDL